MIEKSWEKKERKTAANRANTISTGSFLRCQRFEERNFGHRKLRLGSFIGPGRRLMLLRFDSSSWSSPKPGASKRSRPPTILTSKRSSEASKSARESVSSLAFPLFATALLIALGRPGGPAFVRVTSEAVDTEAFSFAGRDSGAAARDRRTLSLPQSASRCGSRHQRTKHSSANRKISTLDISTQKWTERNRWQIQIPKGSDCLSQLSTL